MNVSVEPAVFCRVEKSATLKTESVGSSKTWLHI